MTLFKRENVESTISALVAVFVFVVVEAAVELQSVTPSPRVPRTMLVADVALPYDGALTNAVVDTLLLWRWLLASLTLGWATSDDDFVLVIMPGLSVGMFM